MRFATDTATKMITAIVFDLDDTLYLEKDFVMSGFLAVSGHISKKYGIKKEKIFQILKGDFEKGLRRKNFDELIKKLDLKDEKVENLVDIYGNHRPSIELCTDAKLVLKGLKNKFKLGLITDGHLNVQKNKIFALHLNQYINKIVINDIAKGKSKSDIRIFENAINKLGIEPKKSVYVGDNPLKDFRNPKKLGMNTIRIKRKNGEYSKISADEIGDADYVISSLMQINKILTNISEQNRK